MAKKVTGIVCGVSWAIMGISLLLEYRLDMPTQTGNVLFVVGVVIGTFSLIALAIMGIIDYARRPR